MAVYTYHATNSAGKTIRGNIAADTARHARDQLRERGLQVRRMGVEQSRSSGWRFPGGSGSRTKLASSVRELATLLAVGIPLTEALDTLCQQYHGRMRTSLMLVRDRVAAGASLASAMREQPRMFDAITVQMVDVGENAGTLDVVLDQLATFQEKSVQLKDRVLTALLYPFIVLVLSLCVCLFLMTVVVPMLLTNLLEAGKELPWPTRVLKGISDVLVDHGFVMVAGSLCVTLVVVLALRTEAGRRWWHRLLLRIPMLGSLLRKQAISRVAFVLSTLMRSGIVYLTAMEYAAKATKNVVLQEALMRSAEAVQAGQDIGPALADGKVMPPLVVHVFSVGQQSGRLEEMLERLSEGYDREVSIASSRFASILEPMLIVTLAVFVGFILFATMLPILEAGNVL